MKTNSPFIASLFCLSILLGCSPDQETGKNFPNPKDAVPSNPGDGDVAERSSEPAVTKITDQVVEASCGQCQFGMEGSGCDLAIRIDGKSYYVDGSNIDDHGDAHADDGLCNCIRKAKVTGEIKDGRFLAKHIEVLAQDSKEEK